MTSNTTRGMEQILIDKAGGAKSMPNGTSSNAINGISPTNPKRALYMNAAKDELKGY